MILRHTTLSIAAAAALFATAYWAHADEIRIATPTELAQSAPPPQGGPQGGPPPREAFEACATLSEAGACAFSLDGTEVEGTCRQPPQGREKTLICVPVDAENG